MIFDRSPSFCIIETTAVIVFLLFFFLIRWLRMYFLILTLFFCCYNISHSNHTQPFRWQQKNIMKNKKPNIWIYFISEWIANLFENFIINLHSSILFIMVYSSIINFPFRFFSISMTYNKTKKSSRLLCPSKWKEKTLPYGRIVSFIISHITFHIFFVPSLVTDKFLCCLCYFHSNLSKDTKTRWCLPIKKQKITVKDVNAL